MIDDDKYLREMGRGWFLIYETDLTHEGVKIA